MLPAGGLDLNSVASFEKVEFLLENHAWKQFDNLLSEE